VRWLLLIVLLAGCQWVNEEEIPCRSTNNCIEGMVCVGASSGTLGTCTRNPVTDDDDAVGDDDDVVDDDDSAANDDDSVVDDDDDSTPVDDDDSTPTEQLEHDAIVLTMNFTFGSPDADSATMLLTATYFEADGDDWLANELCSRRLTAPGTVNYGPQTPAPCALCTGELLFDPALVVDNTEDDPLDGECDPAALEGNRDIAGNLLGQQSFGAGDDFLHLGLLERSVWAALPDNTPNVDPEHGFDLQTPPGNFTPVGVANHLAAQSSSFALTHAVVIDPSALNAWYSWLDGFATVLETDYLAVAYMWLDETTNPTDPDATFLNGEYLGAQWFINTRSDR
jgi:hypothetical protein